jgi:hypothetical protein
MKVAGTNQFDGMTHTNFGMPQTQMKVLDKIVEVIEPLATLL